MRVRLVDADYERTRKLRWLRTNTTTGTSPRVVQPYNRVPPLLFLFLFLLSFPSARFFRWGFYERILRLDQPTSGNSSVDFFFPSFSLLSFFFFFFDLWETFGNRIFVRITYIYIRDKVSTEQVDWIIILYFPVVVPFDGSMKRFWWNLEE